MHYAVIDIETTGGQPPDDRLTEIAIYLFDGQQITGTYHTLLNPERNIPFMVSKLTGITNDMVQGAPHFYQVAKDIVQLTEGRIFVAHNVGFDYGFLKAAFHDLGYRYQRKTLCTLRLSRKVLPGLPSYSLGKLCKAMGIEVKDRHRAYGDAAATTELLRLLLSRMGQDDLEHDLDGELKQAWLPPHLDREQVENLPEQPGVYYFHDADNKVLYVGKSRNIRQRVHSHFTTEFRRKTKLGLRNRIASISYELTGNELIALLLESDEIKKRLPPYNRAQRLRGNRAAVYHKLGGEYEVLELREHNAKNGAPLLLFENLTRARNYLHRLAEQHQLCRKMLGLQKGAGPCHERQMKRCLGACVREEPAQAHNARLAQALATFAYPAPNFAILGAGRHTDEQSIVLVQQHQYRGFGYLPADLAPTQPDQLSDHITPYADNRDVHAIIRGYLLQQHKDRVIYF